MTSVHLGPTYPRFTVFLFVFFCIYCLFVFVVVVVVVFFVFFWGVGGDGEGSIIIGHLDAFCSSDFSTLNFFFNVINIAKCSGSRRVLRTPIDPPLINIYLFKS